MLPCNTIRQSIALLLCLTMVYIAADGSIGKQKPRGVYERFCSLKLQWKVVTIIAVIAFLTNHLLNSNPLANGNIPAAAYSPEQHWNRILRDDSFVRSMTEPLGSTTKRRTGERIMMQLNPELYELHIAPGYHDFGGPDGHDF